jgi:hypothetical protein
MFLPVPDSVEPLMAFPLSELPGSYPGTHVDAACQAEDEAYHESNDETYNHSTTLD